MKKKAAKVAFIYSLPILCSYLFLGTAYGMLMAEAGFPWLESVFVSLTVYTGAFQFVLITFLSSGASLLTVALTAMLMGSRQTFYSLTYLKDFQQMGKRKWYMITTMTDETYAVNGTLAELPDNERRESMFWLALFSHGYWAIGSAIGGMVGQLIPFDLEGIDFCMTALFVIIFLDQWEKTDNHLPAIAGMAIGIVCLLLFGKSSFMLPALILTSGVLIATQRKERA